MITRHLFQIGLTACATVALCSCTAENVQNPPAAANQEQPGAVPPGAGTPITPQKVSKEVGEAYQALKDFSYSTKEDLQQWADRQPEIAALEQKIAALRDAASQKINSQMTPEMKAQIERAQTALADAQLKLEEAKLKFADAKARMAEMRDTTEQTWAESKNNLGRLFAELQTALERATDRSRTAGKPPASEQTPL